jgi:hypothetical protein
VLVLLLWLLCEVRAKDKVLTSSCHVSMLLLLLILTRLDACLAMQPFGVINPTAQVVCHVTLCPI